MEYGGLDASFIQMMERMDAEAAAKKGAGPPKMKGKSTNKEKPVRKIKSKGFSSKHIRGRIFKDASKRLKPDPIVVREYTDYLATQYQIALKKQLRVRRRQNGTRYSSMGYATGTLRSSIMVKTKIEYYHDVKKGRVDIDVLLIPKYADYGDYIASGRKRGPIPVQLIIDWLEQKQRLGVLRIYTKTRRDISNENPDAGLEELAKLRTKRENILLSIAIAIVNKADSAPKPPVLRGWSSWDDNPSLREEFWRRTKEDGAKYRRRIRRSIVKNLSTDYGRTK